MRMVVITFLTNYSYAEAFGDTFCSLLEFIDNVVCTENLSSIFYTDDQVVI